jgi:hypothetical protein
MAEATRTEPYEAPRIAERTDIGLHLIGIDVIIGSGDILT